jgi:hypothetical protein
MKGLRKQNSKAIDLWLEPFSLGNVDIVAEDNARTWYLRHSAIIDCRGQRFFHSALGFSSAIVQLNTHSFNCPVSVVDGSAHRRRSL